MGRGPSYSPKFKSDTVLEVIEGTRELNVIAAEKHISPNMLRNWRKEFLDKAWTIFAETKARREERRKEAVWEEEKKELEQAIGKLTVEVMFLKDCFRKNGMSIPVSPGAD